MVLMLMRSRWGIGRRCSISGGRTISRGLRSSSSRMSRRSLVNGRLGTRRRLDRGDGGPGGRGRAGSAVGHLPTGEHGVGEWGDVGVGVVARGVGRGAVGLSVGVVGGVLGGGGGSEGALQRLRHRREHGLDATAFVGRLIVSHPCARIALKHTTGRVTSSAAS